MSIHPKPFLSDRTYSTLKWTAQVGLPALGTLVAVLTPLWGFPAGDQIVGTILAVDTFLGVALGLSTRQYRKHATVGDIVVNPKPGGGKTYSLDFDSDLSELDSRQEVLFKIKKARGKEET